MRSYLVVSSVSCGNNRFNIASAARRVSPAQWSLVLRTHGEVVKVEFDHVFDHVQVFDTRYRCALLRREL
jgi:hypothetical protein